MKIVIDTNIAYYLAEISKQDNFSIDNFNKLNCDKYISSVSLLEIYNKNDEQLLNKILQALYKYEIGILVFGSKINENEKPTVLKLLKKTHSYRQRIFKYYKDIFKDLFAQRLFILGSLMGSAYVGMTELLENDIKLKNLEFQHIYPKDSENEIYKQFANDYLKTYKDFNPSGDLITYDLIKLMIISVAYYYSRKDNVALYQFSDIEEYLNQIENIEIDPHKLYIKLKNKKNIKHKPFFDRFAKTFLGHDTDLGTKGLVKIVESIFINKPFRINELNDSIIISLTELDDNICVITSENTWINFLRENVNEFSCAKKSLEIINNLYVN